MKCPPDHKHGENQTCYGLHKCRCDDCRQQNREYAYWRKRMIRHGKPPIKSVDATGTRRRIEALMSRGWPAGYLADRLDTTYQQVAIYRTQPRVKPSTAKKVAALYDELWDKMPRPVTKADRIAVSKTLSFAKGRGFLPPLAWDDIDLDVTPPVQDEDEVGGIDEMAVAAAIDGLKPRLTQAERVEVVRHLNRDGWTDKQIAEHVGVATETILRDRARVGIAPAPSKFHAA